jgi:hypothetical protein
MANDIAPAPKQPPPASAARGRLWHKPTVVYVPLQGTGFEVGSAIDGQDGTWPPPLMDKEKTGC